MTSKNDANGNDFIAEARKNLKTTISEHRDYDEIGRETGKALARALFGSFVKDKQPTNSAPKISAVPTGRMGRIAKGVGFFFAVLLTSFASVFVNGWIAVGIVGLSILVCLSRKLKSHGISIMVGVFLLLFVLPLILVGRSVEEAKAELAPLRLSNPMAYLEKARKVLSRNEWMEEAKLLDPKLYRSEYAIDEAARFFEKAVEEKANQKKLEVAAQAKARDVAENQQNSCQNDWTKCNDNTEIVDRYNRTAHMQNMCKKASEAQANYDTEWPWVFFQAAIPGTTGPIYGEIEMIERGAKFQNGFGALQKVRILCQYDLRSERVTKLEVN
jgi:hypothetical protein